jgi:signal transduction histidine kinase
MKTTTPLILDKSLYFKTEPILNIVTDCILCHSFSIYDDLIQTGQFEFANDAAVALSGYSREELLKSNPSSIFGTAPEGWYDQLLKNSLEGKNTPFRTTIFNKASHEMLVEIKICLQENKDSFLSTSVIRRVVENDTSCKGNASEVPFLSVDKMSSLSTLVSGLAHEINNPNNLITLSTDLLKDIWDEVWTFIDNLPQTNPPMTVHGQEKKALHKNVINLLSNILSGSDRINRTISVIRDFIRIDLNEKKTDCDLPSIINSAVLTTNSIIKKSTENLNLIIENDIPPIKGFQQLIQQAFINIINNACEALTETSQKITILMSYQTEANSIIITISDEGEGIAPRNTPLIFDPFFTTRRNKGHLGLGLSVAFSIVHKHKGCMEITSEHGFGTTVIMKIPIN